MFTSATDLSLIRRRFYVVDVDRNGSFEMDLGQIGENIRNYLVSFKIVNIFTNLFVL